MKTTTLEMFREELLKDGTYDTPPERRAPVRRKQGWWTTLSFTWGPFSVFPKCAIYEALGILDTDKWAHFCFRAAQRAEQFGMSLSLDGWKNRADYDGPVVYLSNHMSTLETILLPFVLLTYSPFNVVVKSSLSHLPFLEKAAVHMGLVPIGRKSPREDLMTIFREGCERIGKGNSMLIFPQGSRERVFARKGFSSIGAKLAEKAGVPVIPIAVKTDCEPTRPGGKGWLKDFGTVDPSKDIRISCGPVISGTAREMHAASFEWIKGRLDEWGLETEG
ncbi:MAG: 1-acyl-sn-glycerol-3-phosphate acyltransferase [Kiritimatiellae bacterium]|nr:1-acyl-sn-glycerol-3-phosphate acyltransferase [Kiritimatiellia bacterium]